MRCVVGSLSRQCQFVFCDSLRFRLVVASRWKLHFWVDESGGMRKQKTSQSVCRRRERYAFFSHDAKRSMDGRSLVFNFDQATELEVRHNGLTADQCDADARSHIGFYGSDAPEFHDHIGFWKIAIE